jgi:sec-independent protein translocase protein TatC
VALSLRRRGPSKFERAADGSMTLVEHLIELRTRLFYAALAVVVGLCIGYALSDWAFELLRAPYCTLPGAIENGTCKFVVLGATDPLVVKLKISLWLGLIISGPVWLYHLWAFIAPGLHRHERKWAYVFVAIAAPLFAGGAALAYVILGKSLQFLLEAGVTGLDSQLEVTAYISFVTSMLLLFGVGFEFPLVLLMLNFTGVVTAKRLLSWWRVMVFLCTVFAAIATPDPGPFGMILLAAAMSLLYFISVGVAWINDRRKGRGKELYEGLDDDAASPLDETPSPLDGDDRQPVGAANLMESVTPIEPPAPVAAPRALDRRYDEMT